MTSIYINYPNQKFCLNSGAVSAERFRQEKAGRRVIRLSPETLSKELQSFLNDEISFGASAELNDLWIDIDFGDEVFERSLGEYLKRLLGRRYRPIAEAVIR